MYLVSCPQLGAFVWESMLTAFFHSVLLTCVFLHYTIVRLAASLALAIKWPSGGLSCVALRHTICIFAASLALAVKWPPHQHA